MNVVVALLITAATLLARSRRARLRLRDSTRRRRQEKLTRALSPARARLALVVTAVTVVVGLGPAVAAGVGGVLLVALALRRRAGGTSSADDFAIPLSIDLLGAAMACGALPAVALAAVAPAVSGIAGATLAEAATALSLGADPALVWANVAGQAPALDPAARACARAAFSGAGVADELFRIAARARADGASRRRRRLERAGVWLVLPLGLCFLPAFVLVAVVPVVLSAAPALAR